MSLYTKITTVLNMIKTAIVGKANKVSNPTAGNFAGLNAGGDITDSGKKAADFAEAVHTHAAADITSGELSPARLPKATTSTIGAVKPDGSTITINSSGVITAVGGGGGGGGGGDVTRAEVEAGWWTEWTFSGNTPPSGYHYEVVRGNNQWLLYIVQDGQTADPTTPPDSNNDTAPADATEVAFSWDSGDTAVSITATRYRVAAPVPTKPEDIGAQPAGSYATAAQGEKADAALSRAEAEAGFTEWVYEPSTYDGGTLFVRYNGFGGYLLYTTSDPVHNIGYVGGEADSVSLTFLGGANWEGDVDLTATRTRLPTMSDIPTKTSDLVNDSGFLTQHQQLAPVYSQTPTFSEWTFSGTDPSEGSYQLQYDGSIWTLRDVPAGGEFIEGLYQGEVVGTADATSLHFVNNLFGPSDVTATRTRTDIIGYTLGSQADKPLQPQGDYAPATNIAMTALASDVQTSLGKADTAVQPAALAGYPTRAEVEAGWWSEWTISPTAPSGKYIIIIHDSVNSQYNIWIGDSKDAWKDGPPDAWVENATGNESTISFTLNGTPYTATRYRVAAPVPTKPEDIGAQPAGNYLTQHQQLAPVYSQTPTFSEWAYTDPQGNDITSDVGDEGLLYIPDGVNGPGWYLNYDTIGYVGDLPLDATLITWDSDGIYTATRVRTDIVGYTLGNQATKPLQPQGDYAAKITASGILKGDGSGIVAAAVAGADYQAPLSAYVSNPVMDGTASAGTSTAYAKGDHVHPTDTSRQAKITASGILKGNGSGEVTAATAGTDYGMYSKPSGGIPASDMTSAVQTSLGKADTAVQPDALASAVRYDLGNLTTATTPTDVWTYAWDGGTDSDHYDFTASYANGAWTFVPIGSGAGYTTVVVQGSEDATSLTFETYDLDGDVRTVTATHVFAYQLADREVQRLSLNAASIMVAFPTVPVDNNKVIDFVVWITNGYEVSGVATAASIELLGAIGTNWNIRVAKGDKMSDITTFAAGEEAMLHFTLLPPASQNAIPTWRISKGVIAAPEPESSGS